MNRTMLEILIWKHFNVEIAWRWRDWAKKKSFSEGGETVKMELLTDKVIFVIKSVESGEMSSTERKKLKMSIFN